MHARTLIFPKYLRSLLALYCAASLTHFVHNAEYIGFYPNMPTWITQRTVYLAWLIVTSVGVLALSCCAIGWRTVGALMLMLYGATGFDGLGHYALALCSQHTLAQNVTIWFEVMTGALLMTATGQVLFKYWHTPSMAA